MVRGAKSEMESGERRSKMVVGRRTNNEVKQQRQVSGKKNVSTTGRLPLRQLQIHSAHPYSRTGGKKSHQEDSKPLEKVKSQVDVGCQTCPPSDEDWKMCTEDPPPPKYWELLAERRRVVLAEVLEENRELHQKVEKLSEVINDLEKQQSDTKFYALMYNISSTASTSDT